MKNTLPTQPETFACIWVGNLNTYIGKEPGKTGYVRNRELEFSAKYVPRTELLTKIDDTIRIISAVLASMADSAWASEYPTCYLKKKPLSNTFWCLWQLI